MICDNCKKEKSNVKAYSFNYGKKIKEVTHDYYSAKQTVSTYSLRQESANICGTCVDEKVIPKAVQGGLHIIGPVIMFIVALGVIAPYFSGDGGIINWVIGLITFVTASQLVKSFIPGRYITKQSIGEQIAYDVKVPRPRAKGIEFFGDSESDDNWYFTNRGSFGIIGVIIWLPFHLIYILIRKLSDLLKITELVFGTPLQMALNRLRKSSWTSTKHTTAARELSEMNLTDADLPVLLNYFRNNKTTDTVFISRIIVQIPDGIETLKSICSPNEFEEILLNAYKSKPNNPEVSSHLKKIGSHQIIETLTDELCTLTRDGDKSQNGLFIKETLINIGEKANAQLLKKLQVGSVFNSPFTFQYGEYKKHEKGYNTNIRTALLGVLDKTGDESCIPAIKTVMEIDETIADKAKSTIKVILERSAANL